MYSAFPVATTRPWAAANQGVIRPRRRITLLNRDGVSLLLWACSLAPKDVNNRALALRSGALALWRSGALAPKDVSKGFEACTLAPEDVSNKVLPQKILVCCVFPGRS